MGMDAHTLCVPNTNLCLERLDASYHSALRFLTNCKALTHHCTLYAKAGLPSLPVRRLSHWYTFIYKALLGKLPYSICSLITQREQILPETA